MKHIFSAFLALLSFAAFGQAPPAVCGDSAVIAYADAINCSTTCVQLHALVKGQTPIRSGIITDDVYSKVIPIGFNFNFYGTTYSKCVIGANGLVTFDTSRKLSPSGYVISTAIPANTTAKNSICGVMCDMDVSAAASDSITYATVGTAPNRRFVVNWCNVPMYRFSSTCLNQRTTCQIVIYESCNLIDVFVANKPLCTGWNGGYAIIGVENAAGTAGTTPAGRNYPSTYTCTNEAYRFTPNGGFTAYTVANIGFRPVPLSASTVKWFLGSTQVGTGLNYSCATVGQTYRVEVAGCNNIITSATVKPVFGPTGTLTPVSVCAGATASFVLTLPAGGSWTLGNPAIATVNTSTGVVTGVSAGTTSYTYMAPSGCTQTIQITVTVCCSDSCAWIVDGNSIHSGRNILGTLSNDDIRIFSNNVQRSVIKANGFMGIKQLAPTTTLNVNCVPTTAPSGLRLENLPAGHGNVLVVDGAGYVYLASATQFKQSSPDIQEQLDDLRQQVAVLNSLLHSGKTPLSDAGNTLSVTPNPSNGQVTANYSIAGSFEKAAITVTDNQGRIIATYPVRGNERSMVIDLPATVSGQVIIALLVDGKIVAQQKEIVVK